MRSLVIRSTLMTTADGDVRVTQCFTNFKSRVARSILFTELTTGSIRREPLSQPPRCPSKEDGLPGVGCFGKDGLTHPILQ